MRESSRGPSPVVIEIVAYAPTAYCQCTHCEVVGQAAGAAHSQHKEQWESSLPSELAGDYQKVSDWVRRLFGAYQDRIRVTVLDAASLEGFWKTLRYRIRRYPAVIVDGKKQLGNDPLSAAEDGIARILRDFPGGVPCLRA